MDEQAKGLRDYVNGLRRRKRQVAVIAAALFAISVAVALLIPPSYRSTATILIEQQEIPSDLVRSTISSYADQRIQVISQQVMTRANLLRIIDKYDLYPRYRQTKTTEDLLDRMTKDIKLDILKADVIDQRSGVKTSATIAFSLSYNGETAAGAQRVANELVTLFLNENLKGREQKTAETSAFLNDEAAKLSEHVSAIETKLAVFKAKNMGRLPELVTLNMQLKDRTDSELREVDRDLRSLEDRRIYLEGQLAQIKPNTPLIAASGERILDPSERLKTLTAQYASLSGVYSPSHPDVAKMRREIDALKKETGEATDSQEQSKQLVRLRADLAAAREKYSDDHPDVAKLKRSIAALEAGKAAAPEPTASNIKPENPAYIALQSQLQATMVELKSQQKKRKELESKLATYETRLVQTPQVEREYLDLTRDHEASLLRYREIKTKLMQAQIGQELEKDRKGERFSLIDPPQLPEQPSSPNRPAIMLLGMVLAMGSGVGSAVVAENLDDSVRGRSVLTHLGQAPVLAVIPYVQTDEERRRKRRRMLIGIILATLAIVVGLTLTHNFWVPLDVLWFRAVRGLQNYAPGIAAASSWWPALGRVSWSA